MLHWLSLSYHCFTNPMTRLEERRKILGGCRPCLSGDMQSMKVMKWPAACRIIFWFCAVTLYKVFKWQKKKKKKTEIVIFGEPDVSGFNSALGPISSNCCPFVKSLSVFIDSSFKLDKQISSVVKTSFFQLRLLGKVKPYLPPSQLEKVVHALITNHLYYCNSLYYDLDQSSGTIVFIWYAYFAHSSQST